MEVNPCHAAKTAPFGQERLYQPACVAIWTAARGEWETIKLYPTAVIGWVK